MKNGAVNYKSEKKEDPIPPMSAFFSIYMYQVLIFSAITENMNE